MTLLQNSSVVMTLCLPRGVNDVYSAERLFALRFDARFEKLFIVDSVFLQLPRNLHSFVINGTKDG